MNEDRKTLYTESKKIQVDQRSGANSPFRLIDRNAHAFNTMRFTRTPGSKHVQDRNVTGSCKTRRGAR